MAGWDAWRSGGRWDPIRRLLIAWGIQHFMLVTVWTHWRSDDCLTIAAGLLVIGWTVPPTGRRLRAWWPTLLGSAVAATSSRWVLGYLDAWWTEPSLWAEHGVLNLLVPALVVVWLRHSAVRRGPWWPLAVVAVASATSHWVTWGAPGFLVSMITLGGVAAVAGSASVSVTALAVAVAVLAPEGLRYGNSPPATLMQGAVRRGGVLLLVAAAARAFAPAARGWCRTPWERVALSAWIGCLLMAYHTRWRPFRMPGLDELEVLRVDWVVRAAAGLTIEGVAAVAAVALASVRRTELRTVWGLAVRWLCVVGLFVPVLWASVAWGDLVDSLTVDAVAPLAPGRPIGSLHFVGALGVVPLTACATMWLLRRRPRWVVPTAVVASAAWGARLSAVAAEGDPLAHHALVIGAALTVGLLTAAAAHREFRRARWWVLAVACLVPACLGRGELPTAPELLRVLFLVGVTLALLRFARLATVRLKWTLHGSEDVALRLPGRVVR